MEPKKSNLINATIVAAFITFCGTRETHPTQPATIAPTATFVLPSETPTILPTDTPLATPTESAAPTSELVTPTETSIFAPPTAAPLLPDLVAIDISSPVCQSQRSGGQVLKYVRHVFTIRNIGPGSTQPFGTFSNRIVIIVGGLRYTLDQWDQMFHGLMGTPDLNVVSLAPNDDAYLTLDINLKGNNKYSLEVIANSGASIIPEVDTTNNNREQEFTANCK
jgi:hypothetical protein